MKMLLALVGVLVSCEAFAREIPVFNAPREAFLRMTPAERREKFTDESWRKEVGGGYSRLKWRVAQTNESSRWCRMKGVVNARDLGGLRGMGGQFVKTGLVFRSGQFNQPAPYRLTTNGTKKAVRDYYGSCTPTISPEQGAAIVREYGIRTDLDLRENGQCRGMAGSPLGAGVKFVNIQASAYSGIFSGQGAKRMAEALRLFADPSNYPIVFHCVKGADRTGSLAFVLQALLGVSAEDRLLDWELTAFSNSNPKFSHAKRYDQLVVGLSGFPGATDAEKAEAYVKSIGLTDADIVAIRRNLLD